VLRTSVIEIMIYLHDNQLDNAAVTEEWDRIDVMIFDLADYMNKHFQIEREDNNWIRRKASNKSTFSTRPYPK
jgi:hypothetical protein